MPAMVGEAANPLDSDDSQEARPPIHAALQQAPWRVARRLSSGLEAAEGFLFHAGFDRAPWLAVAFGLGIGAWFALPGREDWLAFLALALACVCGGLALFRADGRFPYVRQALAAMALCVAAGCGLVWVKSALVGRAPIERPMVETIAGTVVAREEEPAEERTRLTVATREPGTGRPIRVRVNVPLERDAAQAREGAQVQVRARLVPPAPPMLPGSYDFARAAWFDGLAATGSALDAVRVVRPAGEESEWLPALQRSISAHVRTRVAGSAGGIAAAFASGDRGGIAKTDEDAMRDAGLTHLLSISGLHVSAVIAAAYFIAIRLFALWPWLVLRVRLPLLAAGTGALAGIAYTLLTGAQVPTVRSCLGALLVLAALALGREPLSLRMLAVAAFVVMLFWPEAVVGPSFQMSFASVIAIIALHDAAPVRAFLAPREEGWWVRGGRHVLMLLATGMVVELALMPIGLFHFHRAGIYGSFANVIAIPLTTFVSMPFIALALLLDTVGLGAPAWWVAGKSLELLLALAHLVAAQPGAVTHLPAMGRGGFALFLAGSLWLALWHGRVRLWGFAPIMLGVLLLASLRPPDLLISGDGAHVGITGLGPDLVVVREPRSDYTREGLNEIAGMDGPVTALARWPGARCSPEFCAIELQRGGRTWRLLMARGQQPVAIRDLAAACALVDIVVADRRLPSACRPRLLKADRALLDSTGGLAVDLDKARIETVAGLEGEHGWLRPVLRPPWAAPVAAASEPGKPPSAQ